MDSNWEDIRCSILVVGFGLVLLAAYFCGDVIPRFLVRRLLVPRLLAEWQRSKRTIGFGPTYALFFAEDLKKTYRMSKTFAGALSLVDRQVVFVPLGYRDIRIIELGAIRWAGMHSVSVHQTRYLWNRYPLVIHF